MNRNQEILDLESTKTAIDALSESNGSEFEVDLINLIKEQKTREGKKKGREGGLTYIIITLGGSPLL
jgi:hypothetical protein